MTEVVEVAGVVVHGRWKPRHAREGVRHALRNARHLRKLEAPVELEKEDWARRMQILLRRARHAANLARGPGAPIKLWPIELLQRRRATKICDGTIGRVCVVASRGMTSTATAALETRGLDCLLGAREISGAVARKIVFDDERPFTPFHIERERGETQLFVKEVKVDGKRCVVCRNEAEAKKDREDREKIVAALDAQSMIDDAGREALRQTRRFGDLGEQRSPIHPRPVSPTLFALRPPNPPAPGLAPLQPIFAAIEKVAARSKT